MAASRASTALRASLARAAAPSAKLPSSSHLLTRGLRSSLMIKSSASASTILPALAARSFHSSARRQLLPPGPQKIQGGVNDPAPIHPPNPMHGSYHWDFERLVSVGLVPLTIAPFVSGSLNPTMDAVLCTTLLIHSHIGFQAIIIDYLPTWKVPRVRKLSHWALRLGTVLVGVGLYDFETNDVGLTELIKRMWKA